jgi:CheY-like chemotaxis protein
MGMVTIPRAEYDRLVADSEMLADLAACDAARAEAGEGMPLAVFSRIVSGENPVKVIREWRGLTQAELARRALVDAGVIFVITRVETRAEFEGQLNDTAPDIILSDYRLPTFDGLEALRIVQRAALNIPFIFVTGTMGEEVAIETLKIGATDYVLKTHLARLGPSVRRALSEALERR